MRDYFGTVEGCGGSVRSATAHKSGALRISAQTKSARVFGLLTHEEGADIFRLYATHSTLKTEPKESKLHQPGLQLEPLLLLELPLSEELLDRLQPGSPLLQWFPVSLQPELSRLVLSGAGLVYTAADRSGAETPEESELLDWAWSYLPGPLHLSSELVSTPAGPKTREGLLELFRRVFRKVFK